MSPLDFAESTYHLGLWKHIALVLSLAQISHLYNGNDINWELVVFVPDRAGKLLSTVPGT